MGTRDWHAIVLSGSIESSIMVTVTLLDTRMGEMNSWTCFFGLDIWEAPLFSRSVAETNSEAESLFTFGMILHICRKYQKLLQT
jgi:hypothetical protein